MAGVNKVILLGNVGQEPEVKHLVGGNVLAKFSLATSESYKNKQGEKVENTEWHNCQAWGKQAEVIEQYVKKGDKLYIEGKIKTDKYEDQEGNKKFFFSIHVLSFTMLGGNQSVERAETPKKQYNESEEENLPF